MRAGTRSWMAGLLALTVMACAALGAPKVPDTPDGTVRFLAEGLAEARPQVLWQGLPPTWQTELTDYLRESAEQSDPELYAAGWAVAGKIARILEEKHAFILDHPMLAAQVKERAKAEAALRAFGGLLETLVGSELSDREALRKIDVEEFLAGTGATLVRQAMEMTSLLEGMKGGIPGPAHLQVLDQLRLQDVGVLSQSQDAARLRVVLAGGKISDQDWVRIEGRWIPKTMADAWPEGIATARRELAKAASSTPERKQAMLVQLRMVDGALDAVLDTSTAAEFQAAASTAFGTLVGAAMAQMQAQGMSPSAGAPAPAGVPSIDAPPDVRTGSQEPADQFLRAHPIAVRHASRHIGESVHVVATGGTEFDGVLRGADGRTLTFERESAAGTMTHAMGVNEVRVLQIWK